MFVSSVNNLKSTEEYIVQHLTSNTPDTSARVVIGTIQRRFSMLKGDLAPAPDHKSLSAPPPDWSSAFRRFGRRAA